MTGKTKTRRIVLGSVLAALVLLTGVTVRAGSPAQEPQPPPTAGAQVASSAPAAPLGSGFTYQGKLEDEGGPVTDDCDMEFRLYSHATNPDQVGSTLAATVPISNGLFTVELDFGSVNFTGDARWLGIQVQCSGDPGFTDLGRQELTPAPYAMALPGMWTEQNGTSPNLVGGYSGNSVGSENVGATIGGGGGSGQINEVNGTYGTIGGGRANIAGSDAVIAGGNGNAAIGLASTIGGGRNSTADGTYTTVGGGYENWAGDDGSTVGGGEGNQATNYYATVGGGLANLAEGEYASIGGGSDNVASGNYTAIGGGKSNVASNDYAAVGGGGYNTASGLGAVVAGGGGVYSSTPYTNTASGRWSAVGGGSRNTASNVGATVGGGYHNTASGSHATIGGGLYNTAKDWGTVGGGELNVASGAWSTVAGGDTNEASGMVSTVGGGGYNTASGHAATVAGGQDNIAAGSYSFAAGRRAKADHDGAFVWADSRDFNFASTTANQFRVRATGGVQIFLAVDVYGDPVWVCYVSNGDSSWTCTSDRNMKENLIPADGSDVLERLSQMPVYYWNAKGQTTQHVGPMAQDFYAAFGVGDSDTAIATIDLDGVALAAIQGLHAQNQALEEENASLQAQVDALQQQNAGFEARLAALEQGSALGASPSGLPLGAWLLPGGLLLGGLAVVAGVVVQRRRSGGGR